MPPCSLPASDPNFAIFCLPRTGILQALHGRCQKPAPASTGSCSRTNKVAQDAYSTNFVGQNGLLHNSIAVRKKISPAPEATAVAIESILQDYSPPGKDFRQYSQSKLDTGPGGFS